MVLANPKPVQCFCQLLAQRIDTSPILKMCNKVRNPHVNQNQSAHTHKHTHILTHIRANFPHAHTFTHKHTTASLLPVVVA